MCSGPRNSRYLNRDDDIELITVATDHDVCIVVAVPFACAFASGQGRHSTSIHLYLKALARAEIRSG